MYNAQTCQDIFVDRILSKKHGFFLDIGAGTGGLPAQTPGFYSNTYFLETFKSWNGIAIDYDESWYNAVKDKRNCKCVCVDLISKNINSVLEENDCPLEIDYLSIDVDDAQMQVFNDFDFDKYRFKILTLEHNLFQSTPECTQNRSEEHKKKIIEEHAYYRSVMKEHGYKLLWGDVFLDSYGAVEDWFVSQDVFDAYKEIEMVNINCKHARYISTKEI